MVLGQLVAYLPGAVGAAIVDEEDLSVDVLISVDRQDVLGQRPCSLPRS
jgi:hypothetical protein